MADEPEPKETKRKKQAVPEPPPAEPKGPLPSASEIRAAKKAELVTWSDRYGLSSEGKVDDLRKRLLAFVAKEETKEAKAEKAEEAEEKEPAAPTEAKKPAARKAAKPEKKEARKPERKAKPKAGEKEEEEEAEVHEARPKPTLDDRLRRLLALRSAKNAQRPKFRRQEWFRYRMFGDEWRKPQGGQSKLRRHFGYRWNLPSIGYRGPREVRGLHPSGFQEVLVHNERQLDGLDAKTQAVRIAHGVGTRKRGIIERACDDKGLRVLNRMVTE
jgi:large subunit ribosomal protein L32e